MKKILLPIILGILLIPLINAELYTPSQERYMETGQNADYLYIKIHRVNQDDYIALSKQNKGEIHIAHNKEYIAKMFLVPAFKHPSNNKWYLCPLKNLSSVSADLQTNSINWNGNNKVTCYRYDDHSLTGEANLTIEGSLTINQEGKIKIYSKITIHEISPTDTGFGYLILPSQTNKYRYAKINEVYKDLTAEEENLSTDQKIEFYDNNQQTINHIFDWTDMQNTGNFLMEIDTFGNQKGLLVGTYGYGANNTIIVDPIYVADYTPEPAKHLYRGDVGTDSESDFDSTTDITTDMSDNLTNVSHVTIDSGGVGQAISGAFNITYDNTSKYFLRMYKTSMGNSGTPYTYAYNDTNNLSNNYTTHTSPVGIGWYNYPIDSLMNYMTNILGLNYTKIRFYTLSTGSWAEMRLRKELNDTEPPQIHDCWTDNNSIGCNGTASWECNITDNLDVNNALFTIDGTNQTATQNDPTWYYNKTFNDTINVNETLTLTDVYAYDIFNQTNHSIFNITIQHICQIYNCTENWIATYGSCQINDSRLKTYYDNNSCGTTNDLPVDNGTSVYCNYCSENLIQTIGECQPNSTQNITYTDTNQSTCCNITGLATDCSINTHPYNTTTYQNCTYLTTNFTCYYDPEPYLKKKMNVICEMPDNKTYCCLVNLYKNNNELLSTHPEYKDASQNLLNLKTEEETRICFTPQQRLLNAYYTPKSIRTDTTFVMEILCTTAEGDEIKAQHFITPTYERADWVTHRLIWMRENAVYLIIGLFILLIIVGILAHYYKKFKGR